MLSFSVRPRAITEEQYPFFSLWAVSPFGGKLPARQLFCVTLPRVHPAFQQRVHWHGATYPAVEALIPFLSPTCLSFRLLWLSSGKIANTLFLLWANMKREHVSSSFHPGDYSCFIVYIVFAPAFNDKHIQPLVSSAEAPLYQVIAVKSFTAAQGMFTAIFSWLNMNKICQRTAHQIRGTVNVLHSDFVCAAGQEISKARTSIFFFFQPVSHNLKGAKGSYLYLIQLNRPISPPSAAALSFATHLFLANLICIWTPTRFPPKKIPQLIIVRPASFRNNSVPVWLWN